MGMQALENHIGFLKRRCAAMPDRRTGNNARHTMADAGMAAFAVFFTQCPSFLAAPRELEQRSNAHALFALDSIPTDNHIRNLLDGVPPRHFDPVCLHRLEDTLQQGGLATMQRLKGKRANWYVIESFLIVNTVLVDILHNFVRDIIRAS